MIDKSGEICYFNFLIYLNYVDLPHALNGDKRYGNTLK